MNIENIIYILLMLLMNVAIAIITYKTKDKDTRDERIVLSIMFLVISIMATLKII